MKKTIFIIFAVAFGVFLVSAATNKETALFSAVEVSNFSDAHGFSVDIEDESKLYIANHNGLYRLTNETKLERISQEQDDFMGFAAHPSDPSIFYASGHPRTGGNLGVLKSVDGGQTFEKISDGINGPVDFHTMTISPVDPSILYGFYAGQLQRSTDGGQTWNLATTPTESAVISISADTELESGLYASTVEGLFMSNDLGDTWQPVYTQDTVINTVVDPGDSQTIVASFANSGLHISADAGKNWTSLGAVTGSGSPIMFIDFSPKNADTLFALTQDLSIHKSVDKGQTWQTMYQ